MNDKELAQLASNGQVAASTLATTGQPSLAGAVYALIAAVQVLAAQLSAVRDELENVRNAANEGRVLRSVEDSKAG